MFKILFELDEERMKQDGLSPVAAWLEIEKMVAECVGLEQKEKGIVCTNSFGKRGWFMSLLEHTPWFMKYVCRWEAVGPNYHDDVLEIYGKTGIKCGYAE